MDGSLSPLTIFWDVLKASTLSTGGLGNAPILHADLVRTHLATEGQFSSALAVGQLSPGPSGLWVVALGYLLGGTAGGMAAFAAVCLPPFVVLAVAALVARAGEHPGMRGLVWGLGVAGAGVSSAVMIGLVRVDIRIETVTIAVVATILGFRTRIPAVVVLLGAAILGLMWR